MDVVAGLIAAHPDLKLGGYLHGSRLHGDARPDSDIDVLMVAGWAVHRSRTRELQYATVATPSAEPIGSVLDLKIHRPRHSPTTPGLIFTERGSPSDHDAPKLRRTPWMPAGQGRQAARDWAAALAGFG